MRRQLHPDDEWLLAQKVAYYDAFDWNEYRTRRDRFRSLDLSDPRVDAPAELRHVLQVGGAETPQVRAFSWDSWYPGETNLWRARVISAEKAYRGYYVDDLWEPPSFKVGAGRFNAQGEPLLYACIGDHAIAPWVAIREARAAGAGTAFILIKYALVGGELRLKRVGIPNRDDNLRWSHRAIEAEIAQLIEDTIRTPAPNDRGAKTYRFTRALLRDLFPLPADGREVGWLYESVQVPGAWNVAIPSADAHRLLEARAVVVGVVDYDRGGADFGVRFCDWTDDCSPVHRDGRIGFPTFKPVLLAGQTPLDLLAN